MQKKHIRATFLKNWKIQDEYNNVNYIEESDLKFKRCF